MTDRTRYLIMKDLAESRRLGKEANEHMDRAIAALRRAARSGRYGGARPARRPR
jgi:t-SNARE complex subunit (syntaxin)